jgi:hypothetical protein
MRLFLYGTLRDPDLLAGFAGLAVPSTPATLRGWRRVALRDRSYPNSAPRPRLTMIRLVGALMLEKQNDEWPSAAAT